MKMIEKESLSKKEVYSYNSLTNKKEYCYKSEDVKECFERIEFRLLKKFKMGSVPIMKIIKEEAGEELTQPKGCERGGKDE